MVLLLLLVGFPPPTVAAPERCRKIRVEVTADALPPKSDPWAETVRSGFRLSIVVSNGCPDEISVLPGSVVTYETSLPAAVGGELQPRDCLDGQLDLAGSVPADGVLRREMVVENCPLEPEGDVAWLSVRGGGLHTSEGDVPYADSRVDLR